MLFRSKLVRGTIAHAPSHAASRHPNSKAKMIVVASRSSAFRGRSSSEFAGHYDKCGVEQSAIIEIFEECGHGGVSAGQCPAKSVPAIIEDADTGVAVHIPGFDADEPIVGSQSHPCDDADQADSGFNQSAGEQQILSEGVSSVAIANVVGFGIDVERIGGVGALQQAEGAILQLMQSFGGGVCGEFGGEIGRAHV